MSVDPVRRRALEILGQVEQGQPLDRALALAQTSLEDPRAAAFLAELVRGTLQWQGRYDHVIAHYARRKAPKDPRLIQLLRLSLHQLLGLDGVPAYAAIHQAGQLCRKSIGNRLVPFVNGLLQAVRRDLVSDDPEVGLQPDKLRALFKPLESDTARWLAAWYSHPQWLVDRWLKNFGETETQALCDFNNQSPALAFHVLSPADPTAVSARLLEMSCPVSAGHTDRSLIAQARLGRAQLDDILIRCDDLIVQDPSVQAATDWLARAGRPAWDVPVDKPLLDMCAAPGGKTVHLAAQWPGTQPVLAMDNRPHRLDLLNATVARIGQPRIKTILGDGLNPPMEPGSCGAVLLDGPCSGTGVLRRHPDGRWQLRPKTPAQNGRRLLQMADKAADLLCEGGLLMYATCSLEPQENEKVLAELLARRDDLVPAADSQGQWQKYWWPHTCGADGFFAARLKRVARKSDPSTDALKKER